VHDPLCEMGIVISLVLVNPRIKAKPIILFSRVKETEMLKRLVFALLLVVLYFQFAVPTVFAAGEPTGGCAPGFTLEMVIVHDNHHHHHVGTDADQNGDGYICMKPVTPGGKIHVHVDNALP
jgi:hypothetical protein